MLKRKRQSSEVKEDLWEGQEKNIPGTSSTLPDKDRLYEDILMQIKNCQNNVQIAKTKLEVLKELADDYFVMKLENGLERMENICDQSMKAIYKSKEKWMSFECLPEIPMRHILQYLDKNNKRNLRLTCKNLKDIVDDVVIFRINTYTTRRFKPSMLKSDCDVDFIYSQETDNEEDDEVETPADAASKLDKVSERVVKISGNTEFFENLKQGMDYSNVKEVSVDGSRIPNKIQFPMLKVLNLELPRINTVPKSESGDFLLNNLVELRIDLVKESSSGLQALLSACRSIKYLTINKCDSGEELKADFTMPNLRKVALCRCSPEFLYIVSGSASTLNEISLECIDSSIITTPPDLQFPNMSKLSLGPMTDQEGLITKFAPSVKELDLNFRTMSRMLELSMPDFPNLKELHLTRYFNEIQAMKIVEHSPGLKTVWMGDVEYPVALPAEQPGDLILGAKNKCRHVDAEKFLETLSKPSRQFGHLSIMYSEFDMPTIVSCELTALTKISIVNCDIKSGLENLLNKCCSTLQELKIEDSNVNATGDLLELKSLKHVSVVHTDPSTMIFRSEDCLTKLLKASKSSLEKVTLVFRGQVDFMYRILQQVNLPNIKILHIHPTPAPERKMSLILEHLPHDVTLWLCKPKFADKTFLPALMNMIRQNDLHVDVAKHK